MSSHAESTIARMNSSRTATDRFQWIVHIGFVVCMAIFILLYSTTYLSLAKTWADTGTFQYAFLIFPLSAVLVWARRHWLARVAARARPIGLIAVAGLGVFWLLGAIAKINLAQHIAVILIWPTMVYVFYGPRVAGVIAFALGYLLFAIPFGNFMVGPLQTVTAHFSVFALKLTGVPVIMEGHFIDTPASAWHVAEACSGIKFFVATVAFGVLYAYLFFTTLKRRLIFVAIALIVPIVANGLRVYFTILIGEHFGLKYASGTDHMIFGWQFFGTVLILLFVCGWPFHQAPADGPIADRTLVENASARMRWMIPVTLAIIILPAAWYGITGWLATQASPAAEIRLPAQLAGVSALDSQAERDAGALHHGLDVHSSRRYGDVARPIQVDYLGAAPGSSDVDMVDIRHRLYDPTLWQPTSAPSTTDPSSGNAPFVVLHLAHGQGSAERIVMYVYRIGDQWTTSATGFKIRRAWNRLIGQGVTTGILVVSEAGRADTNNLAGMGEAAATTIMEGAS